MPAAERSYKCARFKVNLPSYFSPLSEYQCIQICILTEAADSPCKLVISDCVLHVDGSVPTWLHPPAPRSKGEWRQHIALFLTFCDQRIFRTTKRFLQFGTAF
jgi:hypothetical protein